MKVVKSRAPFRIGLAGGGSDVSPYSERYDGCVLNTTISLYAKTTLIPNDNKIVFENIEDNSYFAFDISNQLPHQKSILLQIGAYNHLIQQCGISPFGFHMINQMDVRTGSGLGTSSTILVSILAAYNEYLQLNWSTTMIAEKAVIIERQELKMAGGKQDQYAAALGGTNFLTFEKDHQVTVSPVKLSNAVKHELEFNLILFYNEQRRDSSEIIKAQMNNVANNQTKSIEATHLIKEEAIHLKKTLEAGSLKPIGDILNKNWENKQKMAEGITNETINMIYKAAMEAGASGGKISGAGGGGFMLFYVESQHRNKLMHTLNNFKGTVIPFNLVDEGAESWVVEE